MAAGRSMQERYFAARTTSNLRLDSNTIGSADVLIAAGLVAKRSERKSVALAVWGVLSSDHMTGAHAVAELMAGWLRKRSFARDGKAMPETSAKDTAMAVLKWWRHPACQTCGGHGHPLILNSPIVDESRDCPACHGTGQVPLHRLVHTEYADDAYWLSGEIDTLCAMVFGEMAREIRADMDLL
jgi:hypothetical protein